MPTNHENTPIKHTPGPWKIDPDDEWWVIDSNDEDIACVYTDHDKNLIAAAPELLAACRKKLTAQMLRETALAHELYTARDNAMQAAEEAEFEADEFMRTAIAKAEGKQ